jgi:uncharacterized protein YyaL (SSP411 family)
VLRDDYTPTTVTLQRPPGDADITALAPFTESQTPVDGRAAAYVCEAFRCEAPVTDPAALREQLRTDREG